MPSCFQSFYWTQKELWGTHTLKLLSFYHHNYVDLSFSPYFFFLSFFFFFFRISRRRRNCVSCDGWRDATQWLMKLIAVKRRTGLWIFMFFHAFTPLKWRDPSWKHALDSPSPRSTSHPGLLSLNPPSSFFLSFHLLFSYFLFPSSLLFSLFLSLFFSVARKETKLCDVLVFYLINGGTSPTKTIVAVNCSYQVERMSQWL